LHNSAEAEGNRIKLCRLAEFHNKYKYVDRTLKDVDALEEELLAFCVSENLLWVPGDRLLDANGVFVEEVESIPPKRKVKNPKEVPIARKKVMLVLSLFIKDFVLLVYYIRKHRAV
jgi:hypothetical protein